MKSNNTAFLPSAKGGTDKIFTDADFIFPKDAGGAWDDVASSMPIPHALNYAAKALSQTQDAQNAVEQVPQKVTPGVDTIYINGQGFRRERIPSPAPGDPTHRTTPINGN